jgi:hypothetical protein
MTRRKIPLNKGNCGSKRLCPIAGVMVGAFLALQVGCQGETKGEERPAAGLSDGAYAAPAKDAKTKQQSSTNGASIVKRSALAASAPLSAEQFTAHTPRTLTYQTSEGTTLIAEQEAVPTCHCAGHTWWVRYYAGDTGGQAQRETHLAIDQNGYVSEMEEVDRVNGVEVVYSPPLVLVPDKLPTRATNEAVFRQDVGVVVHPLGDRLKIKAEGKLSNEIVFEGDESVTTGAGTYAAHRLIATTVSDLAGARTAGMTEQWLVDGIGVVVQRAREETRAKGAKTHESASTLILTSFEQGKGP